MNVIILLIPIQKTAFKDKDMLFNGIMRATAGTTPPFDLSACSRQAKLRAPLLSPRGRRGDFLETENFSDPVFKKTI